MMIGGRESKYNAAYSKLIINISNARGLSGHGGLTLRHRTGTRVLQVDKSAFQMRGRCV